MKNLKFRDGVLGYMIPIQNESNERSKGKALQLRQWNACPLPTMLSHYQVLLDTSAGKLSFLSQNSQNRMQVQAGHSTADGRVRETMKRLQRLCGLPLASRL